MKLSRREVLLIKIYEKKMKTENICDITLKKTLNNNWISIVIKIIMIIITTILWLLLLPIAYHMDMKKKDPHNHMKL